MATATLPTTAPTSTLKPSFVGVLRGEIIKVTRQRLLWIGAVVAFLPVAVYQFFLMLTPSVKTNLLGPNAGYYITTVVQRELVLVHAFIGFFLIALTVMVIGLDYQQGTIRIVLSRGVGRVQLLLAKMATLGGIALLTLISYLVLVGILTFASLSIAAGTASPFGMLTSDFWPNTLIYGSTILISVTCTILMATAATVLGRSIQFGMGVALLYFPADTIGSTFLGLIAGFTHQQFWADISAYLLGPLLNGLPAVLVPLHTETFVTKAGTHIMQIPATTVGPTPFVSYDATHYLVVIALYALAFAAIAIGLTWRRDVLE